MPSKKPLLPGQCYHIYNRGNNRRLIFREEENYFYFLRLVKIHVFPIAKIFAYALLPNHFHFLVQIRDEEELAKQKASSSTQISRKFANLFSTYAMAYNKRFKTVSSLFEQNFERTLVKNESMFDYYIYYLHWNPQHHNLVADYKLWKHTSYNTMITKKPTFLERKFILDRFDGVDDFISEHQQFIDVLDQNDKTDLR